MISLGWFIGRSAVKNARTVYDIMRVFFCHIGTFFTTRFCTISLGRLSMLSKLKCSGLIFPSRLDKIRQVAYVLISMQYEKYNVPEEKNEKALKVLSQPVASH